MVEQDVAVGAPGQALHPKPGRPPRRGRVVGTEGGQVVPAEALPVDDFGLLVAGQHEGKNFGDHEVRVDAVGQQPAQAEQLQHRPAVAEAEIEHHRPSRRPAVHRHQGGPDVQADSRTAQQQHQRPAGRPFLEALFQGGEVKVVLRVARRGPGGKGQQQPHLGKGNGDGGPNERRPRFPRSAAANHGHALLAAAEPLRRRPAV